MSGGVYVLQDSRGRKYTLKAHENIEHLKEEIVADALYKKIGVNVPDFAVFSNLPKCLGSKSNIPKNGLYRISDYIEKSHKESADIKSMMALYFIANVLFANWDAVKEDCCILGQDNKLYQVDNGGSLRYRAIKGLKENTSGWVQNAASELNSMRNQRTNESGHKLYGHLTLDEMKTQLLDIMQKSAGLFDELEINKFFCLINI